MKNEGGRMRDEGGKREAVYGVEKPASVKWRWPLSGAARYSASARADGPCLRFLVVTPATTWAVTPESSGRGTSSKSGSCLSMASQMMAASAAPTCRSAATSETVALKTV